LIKQLKAIPPKTLAPKAIELLARHNTINAETWQEAIRATSISDFINSEMIKPCNKTFSGELRSLHGNRILLQFIDRLIRLTIKPETQLKNLNDFDSFCMNFKEQAHELIKTMSDENMPAFKAAISNLFSRTIKNQFDSSINLSAFKYMQALANFIGDKFIESNSDLIVNTEDAFFRKAASKLRYASLTLKPLIQAHQDPINCEELKAKILIDFMYKNLSAFTKNEIEAISCLASKQDIQGINVMMLKLRPELADLFNEQYQIKEIDEKRYLIAPENFSRNFLDFDLHAGLESLSKYFDTSKDLLIFDSWGHNQYPRFVSDILKEPKGYYYFLQDIEIPKSQICKYPDRTPYVNEEFLQIFSRGVVSKGKFYLNSSPIVLN